MKTVSSSRTSLVGAGGFTLVELLVGVMILAIVLAVGVPSFSEVIRVNRLASQVNEYTASLSLARSEAYKRGVPVVVCVANTDQDGCSTTASWASGWLSFVDTNSNNVVDTGETIFQKVAAPPGGFTYTPTPATQTIMFRPLSVSPASFSLEIYKSGCTGVEKRRISVVSTGRIKMERIAC